MSTFSFPIIIILFLISSAVTWQAGITLTKIISTIDTRFKIGDALGGLILLGIVGSLPEIAVTYGAARSGNIPVIIGNLLGGIAMQTLILVIFDFANKKKQPLSYLAGSKILFFETIFAMVISLLAIIGTFIPPKINIARVNPFSLIIVLAWVLGLYLIDKAHNNPKYTAVESDATPGRLHKEKRSVENQSFYKGKSNWYVIALFLFFSFITLLAGYFVEESGNLIALKLNIGSGIFAATAIALVCSLPEISTGLESIFIGDNHLAISDIMGGNAFMVVIFLFADLIARKPVLSYATHSDVLLTALGVVMMAVYAIAYLKKPQKKYFGLGLDSIIQIILYFDGIVFITLIK